MLGNGEGEGEESVSPSRSLARSLAHFSVSPSSSLFWKQVVNSLTTSTLLTSFVFMMFRFVTLLLLPLAWPQRSSCCGRKTGGSLLYCAEASFVRTNAPFVSDSVAPLAVPYRHVNTIYCRSIN
eukprot:scaffold35322_cov313-Amphora_coffeaeformis.AAC.2